MLGARLNYFQQQFILTISDEDYNNIIMTFRPTTYDSDTALAKTMDEDENAAPYPPPVHTGSPSCLNLYETVVDAFNGCFEGYSSSHQQNSGEAYQYHGSSNNGRTGGYDFDSRNDSIENQANPTANAGSYRYPPATQNNSDYVWPPTSTYHTSTADHHQYRHERHYPSNYHRRSWTDYEYASSSFGYNGRFQGDNTVAISSDDKVHETPARSYSYDTRPAGMANYPPEYDYYYSSRAAAGSGGGGYSSSGRYPQQAEAPQNRTVGEVSTCPSASGQPMYGQEAGNPYIADEASVSSSKPKKAASKVVVAGQLVDALRDLDIVCGRGAPSAFHYGNQAFKELAGHYQTSYLCAKRSDKPEIAMKVLDIVKDRGGRFVRRKKTAGHFSWETIGDKAAYERVCQALREGAPDLRQKMLSASSINQKQKQLEGTPS